MLCTSCSCRAVGAVQGGLGAVVAEVLASVHATTGLEAARRMYTRLMQGPPLGGDFLLAVLRVELGVQGPSALPAADLRRLFEVRDMFASCSHVLQSMQHSLLNSWNA